MKRILPSLKLGAGVLALALTLGTSNSFGQTKSQKDLIKTEYNQTTLTNLQQRFEQRNAEERTAAYEQARKQNIPTTIQFEDGGFGQLQRFSSEGTPVYYRTFNVGAAVTTRANTLNSGGSLGLNVNGQNMTVGIWDGGPLRTTHQTFGGRATTGDGNFSSCDGNSGHANHVAGTMVGGTASGNAQGMAYEANIVGYDWTNDLAEATSQANSGLLLSNHSYGYAAFNQFGQLQLPVHWFGKYLDDAHDWDEIMFNAPYYQMVNAAGNDRRQANQINNKGGYDILTGHSVSKNAIVVAAVNEVANYTGPNSVTMSDFSNWGPTDDGRIKPDISAKGVDVYSAYCNSNSSYATLSGTSMASPNTTGTLLLVQQHYNNVNGSFMYASQLRGLALHTADEAGNADGPDYAFGWGLLNAEKAAKVISNNNGTDARLESHVLNSGASYSTTYTSDGSAPLEVTICWTDPAGNVVTSETVDIFEAALVNDLDVRVTSGGTTYLPWKLNPGSPSAAATKADNSVDNIEKVAINNPAAGTYTITVTHKGSLTNGNQRFALIITGTDLAGGNNGGGGGGACASTISAFPYGESFESGLGAWAQGAGDDLDWTNNSGGTPSNGTGPSAASDGSSYMYVEASSPNYPSKTTYLDGPCFDLTGQSGGTFGFDYQMDGTDVGSLTLEAKPDGGSWTSVWTISGAQGTAWQSASVDLASYAGASVQLRFTGVTGAGWSSDIAVDNVSLTTGSAPTCDVVPAGLASSSVAQTTFTLTWDAVAGAASYDVDINGTVLNATTNSLNVSGATAGTTYACAVRTNCASGSSPYSAAINVTTQSAGGGGNGCTGGIASFPYGESFESGLGAWSQGTGDDNDWTRDSGGTPSSGTGPSTGAAGSWYMFLETSGNGTGYPSKTAYLNGPCFDLGSESSASFGFEYHMNGTAVGSLDLQASDDNGATWTSVWNITGSQGDAWNSASVDLAAYTGGSVQVRFLATSGSGWSSDIAVDNISVSTTGGGGGGSTTSTVTLTLITDQYGSETSWSLTDAAGNEVASGNGYSNVSAGETITETFTLAAGCYDFTINDSYGDGICCTYGNGSYSLTEGSTTLASGGSFGSTETKNFCVTATSSTAMSIFGAQVGTDLIAYPNPANTEVSIRAAGFDAANYTVMDITGKQVTQGKMVNGEANISLKGIKAGVYIIRATQGEKILTTKLVKQ